VTVPSCLVIQHVECEGSFAIGAALSSAGVTVDTRKVFAGDPLPDVSMFDGLVVMGGPMSACSDDGFPTRASEIGLISDALDRGILTLGVCLGAQLLAVAAGGSVFAGDAGPEIGWGPVDLTPDTDSDPLLAAVSRRLTVLHWHGDTFDLPAGATRLASSRKYPNQAYRLGAHAWGLQFHVEVDDQAVRGFLDAFGEEARTAGEDPEAIAIATGVYLDELGPIRDRVCGRFAHLVGTHDRDQDLVESG
jgi:GMP synthase-like glutamine amidotransferase